MTARATFNGDVIGPPSSTDEALARFDLATGKRLQNSLVTVTDTGHLRPAGDVTQDLGSASAPKNRWKLIHSRQSFAVGGNTPVTVGSNGPYGVVSGRCQVSAGTGLLQIGGGSFPPIGLFGNVFCSSASASATMKHLGGGAFMAGSAYAVGSGTMSVETRSSSFGSFTGGYAYGNSGIGRVYNAGSGAFLWGYAHPTNATANHQITTGNNAAGAFVLGRSDGPGSAVIRGEGAGSFTQGVVSGVVGTTSTIKAAGAGSFAQGRTRGTSTIQSLSNGSFAQGNTDGGTITSSGIGCFAQGQANSGGLIQASGEGSVAQGDSHLSGQILASTDGAFAQGRATNSGILSASANGSFAHGNADTNNVTASGVASLAIGDSTLGAIAASGAGSCQFGPGTNNLPNSLQVGNAGVRFKGDVGPPGVLQDGDIWVNAGYVYIRSNGVSQKI